MKYYMSRYGPITGFLLLLVFVGVCQLIFLKIGMSTLIDSKDINGFTYYYFNINSYLQGITSNVDCIQNLANNVYSDFSINTDNVLNAIISVLNSLIGLLNFFSLGTAFLIQVLPLICAFFGFAGGGINYITMTAEMVSSFHIPYIPYV